MDSTQAPKKVIKIGDLVGWKYNPLRLAIVLKVYDDESCDVQWLNYQDGLQIRMPMCNLLHVGKTKESRLYGNR
jgi:hypothetical protein